MAGRTFFVTKTPTTPNEEPMETFADMPNDINVVNPTAPAPASDTLHTACLTEILGEPITTVRNGILMSFVSSLNLQLVTRCRQALRDELAERDARAEEDDGIPSIDQRNDAEDATGINSGCYNQGSIEEANAAYAGNPIPMSAREIAKRLAIIRSYCHEQQQKARLSNVTPFVPRPLKESVEWLKSQLPTNSQPSDPAIRVAMSVTGESAERCIAIRNAGNISELHALCKIEKEMIDMGEGLTAGYEPDAQTVEEAFDSLPAQVKVNILISALNGCVSSYNTSFKRVLTRGDVAAAGDMPIAKKLYERGVQTLHRICTLEADDLHEFEARGGQLKELKRIG